MHIMSLSTKAHLSRAASVLLVYVHASLVSSAVPFTNRCDHTGQPLVWGPRRAMPALTILVFFLAAQPIAVSA